MAKAPPTVGKDEPINWQKRAEALLADNHRLAEQLRLTRSEADAAIRERDEARASHTKARDEAIHHKNRAWGLAQRVDEHVATLRRAGLDKSHEAGEGR